MYLSTSRPMLQYFSGIRKLWYVDFWTLNTTRAIQRENTVYDGLLARFDISSTPALKKNIKRYVSP